MAIDPVSEKRLTLLHPPFKNLALAFLEACDKAGFRLRVTYGMRTLAEQAELYAQGRTKPGKIVTNAKPGSSAHNYGAAIDVVFLKADGQVDWNGPWEKIGKIGTDLGLVWGGNFKSFVDRPHFEWANWRSLRQAPNA